MACLTQVQLSLSNLIIDVPKVSVSLYNTEHILHPLQSSTAAPANVVKLCYKKDEINPLTSHDSYYKLTTYIQLFESGCCHTFHDLCALSKNSLTYLFYLL